MSWTQCSNGHVHWGRHGAAGLLVVTGGTVLLQLRASWASQGGTWSIPGGALERHESPVDGALREAEEELGLVSGHVIVAGSRTALCGGWPYETVLARVHPGVDLGLWDRSESDGHRWVPWADVGQLRLHRAFRAAWEDHDDVLRAFVAT